MRFPRALSIRDDLSVADCMTARGKYISCVVSFLALIFVMVDVMENFKSEKKRKTEEEEE